MTTAGRSSVFVSSSPSSPALRRDVVRHIYLRQGVIEYLGLKSEATDAGENVDDDDDDSAGNDTVPMISGRPPTTVTSSAAVVGGRPRSQRSSFALLASHLMPTIQEDEELKIVPPAVNVNSNHRVSSPISPSPTSPPLPPSSPSPQATNTTNMPLPPGYPLPNGQAAAAAPRVAVQPPAGYYEELQRMRSEFWRQGNAGVQLSQHATQFQYQSQQQSQQQHALNVNGANMLRRAHVTLPPLPAAASSNNLARGFTIAAPPQHVHTHAHAGYAGYHATSSASAGPHNRFMNPNFNANPGFINNNAHNHNHNLTRPSTTTSTSTTQAQTNMSTNMYMHTMHNNPTTTITTTNHGTTPAPACTARPFDPDAPLPPGMRGPPIISPMVPFYTHLEALALLRRRFVREQLRREGRAEEEELVGMTETGLW